MTEKDLLIQDLRRENETLRKELEWKEKVIELARRHETIIHEPTKSEFRRMAIQLGYDLVVQCKDCKHFDRAEFNCKGFKICPASGMDIKPDDYCSYGERKDVSE